MATKVSARKCSGCGKGQVGVGGIGAIDGAYWHPPCYRKATPGDRKRARKEMAERMRKERGE